MSPIHHFAQRLGLFLSFLVGMSLLTFHLNSETITTHTYTPESKVTEIQMKTDMQIVAIPTPTPFLIAMPPNPTPTPISIPVRVIDRGYDLNPNSYIQGGIAKANEKLFSKIGMKMSAPTVVDSPDKIFEVDCDQTEGNLVNLTKEYGNKWQDDEVVILIVGLINTNCGGNGFGLFAAWKEPGQNKGRKLIFVSSGLATENLANNIAHEFGHMSRMNHVDNNIYPDNFLGKLTLYNDWGISTSIPELEVSGNPFYMYPVSSNRNQIETLKKWMDNNNEWNSWQ